jgi:hypothetical protein
MCQTAYCNREHAKRTSGTSHDQSQEREWLVHWYNESRFRHGVRTLPTDSLIPAFRADGYLPMGVLLASEADVVFRFGTATKRRRLLVLRLRRWIELARAVAARRLLLDGSFVTAKAEPEDVDAVLLLPADFQGQLDRGGPSALELEAMLLSRQPEEIFAAEDDRDWADWIEFFSRTREADGRRKGLVEISL